MEINKIYQMDFREFLKQFQDKEIDLLLIDPPYGIDIGSMNFTKSIVGGVAKRTDYRGHNKEWDKTTLSKEDIDELIRVSKNQIIFGANHFAHLLPASKCWVVWDKRTAEKYNNDFADCELIWTSFAKPARIIRWLWSGMLQGDMKNKEKRVHPTQKPLYVIKKLIEMFSKETDLIVDCFAGSGTTLLASKELKRNWIGCELQEEYVKITKERLSQESLFPLAVNKKEDYGLPPTSKEVGIRPTIL